MVLARRKFLRTGLLFGASAVLFYGNVPSAFGRTLTSDGELSREVLADPLYSFNRQTFEPYIGGYFQAPGARGEVVALKLSKVEAYAPPSDTRISTAPTLASDAFRLVFQADGALPTLTSIHPIKHGALGDFKLFLTRRNGLNREIFYEAVLNRLR